MLWAVTEYGAIGGDRCKLRMTRLSLRGVKPNLAAHGRRHQQPDAVLIVECLSLSIRAMGPHMIEYPFCSPISIPTWQLGVKGRRLSLYKMLKKVKLLLATSVAGL